MHLCSTYRTTVPPVFFSGCGVQKQIVFCRRCRFTWPMSSAINNLLNRQRVAAVFRVSVERWMERSFVDEFNDQVVFWGSERWVEREGTQSLYKEVINDLCSRSIDSTDWRRRPFTIWEDTTSLWAHLLSYISVPLSLSVSVSVLFLFISLSLSLSQAIAMSLSFSVASTNVILG